MTKTRFEYAGTLPDGTTVYSAQHEIWNSVSITFPPEYWGREAPRWVEVPFELTTSDTYILAGV